MRAGSLFPFLNEVDCLAWDSSVCYNSFILINTLYLTYYWTWTHVMLLNKGLWIEYKFLWYELCVWVMQMCRPVLPELHSSTTSSSSGSMSRQASLWWYSVFIHTERRSFTDFKKIGLVSHDQFFLCVRTEWKFTSWKVHEVNCWLLFTFVH